MKASIPMLAALAAIPLVAGTFVEDAAAKKVKATRSQVSAACKDNKGATEYGTEASSGHYGCITASGNGIDCDPNGNCESWGPNSQRSSRNGSRVRPSGGRHR